MAQKNRRTSKPQRPYPRNSLEDAVKIPTALRDKNGGNSWPPAEVAKAIGSSKGSSTFFYQTSSAQAFGLTKGTRDASRIELEPLGRSIVYAPSATEELENKRKSFFSVDIFKKVFDHYSGSQLPEAKYLGNTLENEFSLHPEFHEEFLKLFRENCKYLGLETSADLSISSSRSTRSPAIKTADSETVVLSESKNKGALKAFIVIPFSERSGNYSAGFFGEVLNSLITPAAADAGFDVVTARRTGSDIIQSTIINALIEADLVIADLTEHNPNVLFELGVRMALDKPILLIRARGTDKIFDVDNMLRVFDYSPTLWTSSLSVDVPELTDHIKSSWDQRSQKTYMQLLKGV